eukprot:g16521.t1
MPTAVMPPMTFDAFPYELLRRVAAYLGRGDMSQLSRADMKRAVLSFCVWERTSVAKGGGLAAIAQPHADGDGGMASGRDSDEDYGRPLGAPIYRFLAPSAGERAGEVGEGRCNSSGGSFGAKAVLASYPRSGNSLLRRLLEEVTGTITGSDTRPDRTLSRSLSVFGLQGEGVVDHRVRVVKTHYPERLGFRPFEGSKTILLVRNPFDAIDSYFNMALTNTHDQSLHDFVYDEFREFWDGMIRNEMKVWERFHFFWLSTGVPIHVVRYEDLLSRPEKMLADIVAFVHDMSTAEVEETYGDRIRRAPAVVHTSRHGNSRQAIHAPAADARQDGVAAGTYNADAAPRKGGVSTGDGAMAGFNGHPASSKGSPTAAKGGGATANNAAGGAPATGANGTGLYQPRTSGRSIGGSLKRFTDDQVAWCVRETGNLLRRLGYDPVSQGFPPIVGADLLELDRLQSMYATADSGRGGKNELNNSKESGGCEGESAILPGNGEAPPGQPGTLQKGTVTVNDKAAAAVAAVRGEKDAYGRAMTPFRRSHTRRDTQPLPLRGEDLKAEGWRQRRRAAKGAKSRDTPSSDSASNKSSSSSNR